jgi:HD-GYP domain-containing protein (c-di-GMP phosphodiesterase class II)
VNGRCGSPATEREPEYQGDREEHAGGRDAVRAIERARSICSEETLGPIEGLTFSVGICDLAEAGGSADEVYRLADTALYEAKRRGRNCIVLYRPSEVVAEPSAGAVPSCFERDLRLQAIQTLSRSLDGHAPGSWTHSERVADLAAKLAGSLGWTSERTAELREAALVHDVGKVGVPAWLLEKR